MNAEHEPGYLDWPELESSFSRLWKPQAPQILIGIYGISGSGKSYLLNQLKAHYGTEFYTFFEGADAIAELLPEGLGQLKNLNSTERAQVRTSALENIKRQCASSGKIGVIAGHYMICDQTLEQAEVVWTELDQKSFSHIIYLDMPSPDVQHRRQKDTTRIRPSLPVGILEQWKNAERSQLRALCYQNGIMFSRLTTHPDLFFRATNLFEDFRHYSEERNHLKVISRVDQIVEPHKGSLDTMLVIDGDKTFAPDDTGDLFWGRVCLDRLSWDAEWTAPAIFCSKLGYTHQAFRQLTMLHEEVASEEEFEFICDWVATQVTPYSDLVSLLTTVADDSGVCAILLTCGLAVVWEKILAKANLSQSVKVIGNGRLSDGCVITPLVKGAVVAHLRSRHALSVCAFGDSPLDLPMLREANRAIVVVGQESTRSKSMDRRLKEAIDEYGLRACQVLFPPSVSPRLEVSRLPVLSLADIGLIDLPSRRRPVICHATQTGAAKLLMTSMRDMRLSGPALRQSHRQAGYYLAIEYITKMIGVDEYEIPHVQGHSVKGYRLRDEPKTIIAALMRGGEPLALGINDAFPLASFLHMNEPADLKQMHCQGQATLMLVDSVINTGKSIESFVKHIRTLTTEVRIIVVAGVVQAQCVAPNGLLARLLSDYGLELIALRFSDNKFTGRGGTDTGNRLFNTTRLD